MSDTLADRLCRGLLALGWRVDFLDRSKYTAFTKPGSKRKYFVGTNGALRVGDCASRSYSIGCPADQTEMYKLVLKHGERVDTKSLAAFE